MLKRIVHFFSKPIRLVILNAILLLIVITLNIFWQVFCLPSGWALVLISICFANTILYPISIRFKRIHWLIGFLNGVSFCLFIYCIIFLSHMNYLGLIMILVGVGLVTFIPHFLALQIFWKSVVKPISKMIKYAFIAGVLMCFLGTAFIGYQYKQALAAFEIAEDSNFETLEKNFLNEKIIGMHFIYHTKFCEFDGWRPPIHEPILVLGMWLNGGVDPLNLSLEERVELYKTHYPENRIKFDCSCAIVESSAYHNDLLLQ
ncbi:MAG: hypothetical protein GQ574_14115 [Crocinitomix sp.]|nr:hypothetical protein [Crocinitomix sp.]